MPAGNGARALWDRLRTEIAPLGDDRPLAAEVQYTTDLLRGTYRADDERLGVPPCPY